MTDSQRLERIESLLVRLLRVANLNARLELRARGYTGSESVREILSQIVEMAPSEHPIEHAAPEPEGFNHMDSTGESTKPNLVL